ncbi:CACTA en-spm transposon protein [Cucumis melo var. makuwa]|uniref:CACTA en-spm transposon protein n=1 Tax=Cucumis melo var. makuwa TaxID=1194695 RepID=A0A5D3DKP3_CUCMM|nr:CACTA en-spm transposon protein [Cucumis melo var. makuwa]
MSGSSTYIDVVSTMSSFPSGFQETGDLFLEFNDVFNNVELFSVGDTSAEPQPTCTPRRRQHSQNLELERYIQKNGKIPISIAPRAKKPISLHVVRFNNIIVVLTWIHFQSAALSGLMFLRSTSSTFKEFGEIAINILRRSATLNKHVPTTKQIGESFKRVVLPLRSLLESTILGSQPLSVNKIFKTILDRRPDYSKGLRWGPKPKSRNKGSNSSSSSQEMHSREVSELRASLECSQSKFEEQRSELEEAKRLIEEQRKTCGVVRRWRLWIPMSIALGAKKPISSHTVQFSQAIGVCVRHTFSICYLRWADVRREYIEVVKGDVQRHFVLDFNDQAMTGFIEHQIFTSFKEFIELNVGTPVLAYSKGFSATLQGRDITEKDIEAANFTNGRNEEDGRRNESGTKGTMIPCGTSGVGVIWRTRLLGDIPNASAIGRLFRHCFECVGTTISDVALTSAIVTSRDGTLDTVLHLAIDIISSSATRRQHSASSSLRLRMLALDIISSSANVGTRHRLFVCTQRRHHLFVCRLDVGIISRIVGFITFD